MRKVLLHAGFWLLFFLLWDRLLYFYVNNEWNRLYFSALDTALIMLAFYSIYYYLMPAYFKHKSLTRLVFSAVLVIGILAGLAAWIMGQLLQNMIVPINFKFNWTYRDMQYNRVLTALTGVLAGSFVKLAADRFEARKKVQALEKERAEAELTYLKAQLNPHFLFNSLNSLYAQLELRTGDPKQTLAALADLLRYQLYEGTREFVPLAGELAYLGNYIALQQMRLDNCTVHYQVDGETDLLIAPLLLITFVENAFKHVSDADHNFIEVKAIIAGDRLRFSCRNSYQLNNKPTGIGLTNVRKRLSLIYQDGFDLAISVSETVYEVNLTLCLKF